MRRFGGKKIVPLSVTALVILSGCQQIEKLNPLGERAAAPACPQVRLLADADRITVYRPGPGRDITDIMYEAAFKGFTGECDYQNKVDGQFTSVNVLLNLQYEVVLGPATPDRTAEVNYFVAIPEFYPRPEGRSEFKQRVRFPGSSQVAEFNDTGIQLTIPLTSDRRGSDTRVLIGFALTPEQLDLNRKLQGPQLSN